MKKRLLSAWMVLCVVLCLVPAAALAANAVKEAASAEELTAAAADGAVDTIRLAADIDIPESLTVSRKVTLDLNGKNLHFLSESATGSVVVVPAGGDLTVIDSSAAAENPAGNGKISGGNGTVRSAIDIAIGKPYRHGGGILVEGGTVTMTAGNIADNIAEMGGGVAVMSGSFHMSGGTIRNCTGNGDLVYSGGGIKNCSTGTVMLSGTASILNCSGRSKGGAILNCGKMTIRDAVTIDGCSAGEGCAGVYSLSDEFEIVDGEFHGDMHIKGGGFDAAARPKISGGTFYDKFENDGAIISDGIFLTNVRNRGGIISGGLFKEQVNSAGDTSDDILISGGVFMKLVHAGREDIDGEVRISGGMFYGGIAKIYSFAAEILGHTVMFMADGKEYARQVVSGDAVTVQPIDPAEKKYYLFDGWYDGETKFTFGGKVDADITLTAGWNEIPAFQLRINEETNEWEYSQDHGETWTSFGVKASSGEKGEKGDTGAQGEKGDTGAPGADGATPRIGDNGNWWIGDTDTGVNATGNKGEKGEKGDTGAQGEKGEKGADGQDGKDGKDGVTPILKIGPDNLWYVSYDGGTAWMSLGVKATGASGADGATPRIGDNGNWWIGDTDTGVNATGNKGEKGEIGEKGDTGAQGEKGEKGADGQDGKDGKDGVTPILKIGPDNLWYVSYDGGTAWISLGVKATGAPGADGEKGEKGDKGVPGADGKDGIGIAKAELNANGELVLTYTDGNTVNVGRVVGADGKDGSAVNTDAVAEPNISPVMRIIGVVAGISFLGNLALLLYLVLRKKEFFCINGGNEK